MQESKEKPSPYFIQENINTSQWDLHPNFFKEGDKEFIPPSWINKLRTLLKDNYSQLPLKTELHNIRKLQLQMVTINETLLEEKINMREIQAGLLAKSQTGNKSHAAVYEGLSMERDFRNFMKLHFKTKYVELPRLFFLNGKKNLIKWFEFDYVIQVKQSFQLDELSLEPFIIETSSTPKSKYIEFKANQIIIFEIKRSWNSRNVHSLENFLIVYLYLLRNHQEYRNCKISYLLFYNSNNLIKAEDYSQCERLISAYTSFLYDNGVCLAELWNREKTLGKTLINLGSNWHSVYINFFFFFNEFSQKNTAYLMRIIEESKAVLSQLTKKNDNLMQDIHQMKEIHGKTEMEMIAIKEANTQMHQANNQMKEIQVKAEGEITAIKQANQEMKIDISSMKQENRKQQALFVFIVALIMFVFWIFPEILSKLPLNRTK